MNKLAMDTYDVCINIGGMPILLHTYSARFEQLLKDRYGPFVVKSATSADLSSEGPATGARERRSCTPGQPQSPTPHSPQQGSPMHTVFELEIELIPPGIVSDAEDARVRLERGCWVMERGDFRAEWDPERHQGWVRQSANPYSIDSVLRILHSLLLAREGGFLVHAASAVRNGRAFLFAGVSGVGKTTISRLAPPDVVLLTDEISYVRAVSIQETGVRSQKPEVRTQRPASELRVPTPQPLGPAFEAFGTPFAGELARIGENVRAPIAALYLLAQGAENRMELISEAEALRVLLQNTLFFARDEDLVRLVFESAFDFVSRVPVRRLVFAPDARVWGLIE